MKIRHTDPLVGDSWTCEGPWWAFALFRILCGIANVVDAIGIRIGYLAEDVDRRFIQTEYPARDEE